MQTTNNFKPEIKFWKGKTVLITGGTGFLGKQIVERLEAVSKKVVVPRKRDYNLINYSDALRCMIENKPDIVIHSAAFYGGIWINKLYPGKIFFDNLSMGLNVMEASRLCDVKKYITVGTACAYPGHLEDALKEEDFWNGITHDSVINYGIPKRVLQAQGIAYAKQYDFKSIHVILTNLYGPGDSYNPDRSHVVAALIRKFVEAYQSDSPTVEVWGTGKPIREFLYVEDAAEGIIRSAERYHSLDPINIAHGKGVTIKELADAIQSILGYKGKIVWNSSKPDGQMVKFLSATKMKKELKWSPQTNLKDGLTKTIKWYIDNKSTADERF